MAQNLFSRRRLIAAIAGCCAVWPELAPAQQSLGKFNSTQPPRPVPEIKFSDEDGEMRSLADFTGKVVLLNVWATWCPPCVLEMSALDRLAQYFSLEPRFAFVPISMDRKENDEIRDFIQEMNLHHFPLYKDAELSINRRLKPRGLPFSLLLNADGEEIGRALGGVAWDAPEMIEEISRSLSKLV